MDLAKEDINVLAQRVKSGTLQLGEIPVGRRKAVQNLVEPGRAGALEDIEEDAPAPKKKKATTKSK